MWSSVSDIRGRNLFMTASTIVRELSQTEFIVFSLKCCSTVPFLTNGTQLLGYLHTVEGEGILLALPVPKKGSPAEFTSALPVTRCMSFLPPAHRVTLNGMWILTVHLVSLRSVPLLVLYLACLLILSTPQHPPSFQHSSQASSSIETFPPLSTSRAGHCLWDLGRSCTHFAHLFCSAWHMTLFQVLHACLLEEDRDAEEAGGSWLVAPVCGVEKQGSLGVQNSQWVLSKCVMDNLHMNN